jgi:hypothetical protein
MLSQSNLNKLCRTEPHTLFASNLCLGRSGLSSSSTVAQQRRSSHVADYAKGLGALVSSKRIPEAVEFLEASLERKRKLHALSTGDLLEGERRSMCGCEQH